MANKLPLQDMFFHPLVLIGNIIASVVFGLILFNYLQKEGAGTFFHSLPIKRAVLYWQNLLAGLTLIWLPIVINGLLTYGILGIFGISQGRWLSRYINSSYAMGGVMGDGSAYVPIGQVFAFWLFISLLMTAFFYIFTVFVGMFTGNVLLQGALTVIGLMLPLGIYMLVKFNLWKLLYGYPRDFDGNGVEKLSPLIYYLNIQNFGELFRGWHWYAAYLAVTLVLCGASIILYKARAAEAAGETLAAGWIRQLFKYGVTVCAALSGGLYFSTISENSTAVIYLGYLIGGVLGYAISDMIAFKSFRFYEHWKGLVVFGSVFLLIIGLVKLDFFSYVKYVPVQSEVKAVSLSILNRNGGSPEIGWLREKDNIASVTKLHQQIILREQENKALINAPRNPENYSLAKPVVRSVNMIINTDITYVLNNGKKVKRTYSIDVSQYRELLYPLVTSQEAKKIMYRYLFKIDGGIIDQINVNNFRLNKNIRLYKPKEISEALAAMRKDVLNISYEASMEDKAPNRANIEFVLKTNQEKQYYYNTLPYYMEFKNLDAFLASHGYLGELFINPEDISTIIVKSAESEEIVEVKEISEINVLLNMGSLGSENYIIERQKQSPFKEIFYYGKVVKKNGQTFFVVFDTNPYFQKLIAKMIQEK
jgi:ABC-2 type transport system permease protein